MHGLKQLLELCHPLLSNHTVCDSTMLCGLEFYKVVKKVNLWWSVSGGGAGYAEPVELVVQWAILE